MKFNSYKSSTKIGENFLRIEKTLDKKLSVNLFCQCGSRVGVRRVAGDNVIYHKLIEHYKRAARNAYCACINDVIKNFLFIFAFRTLTVKREWMIWLVVCILRSKGTFSFIVATSADVKESELWQFV